MAAQLWVKKPHGRYFTSRGALLRVLGRQVEMPVRPTEAESQSELEARAAAWQRLARGPAWGDLRAALAQTAAQGPSGDALAF